MKSITKWTLYMRRISTMWWCIAISLFMFINLIFYPTFKDDADELQKSFENIPDAALQLLGGSADFFSPVGYLNSQVFFIMLPMLLGILAISLGSKLLAEEEQNKTIESLLSRPVSRSKLLASKALAGSLLLTFVAIVSWASISAVASYVDIEVGILPMFEVTAVCLMLVATFGAVAYLLSATGRGRSASIGIATFYALGGYIIDSLASTVTWLEWPSKFFPFHYYHSSEILLGTYDWKNIWYFVVVLIACSVLSWIAFRKRDL